MNDQALVIGIKKYLHTNGYNSNNRGGRQQHSHVCRVRRTMLEEQIRAIITSPQVLVYQRDNGGRVRCPPVITSGTIAEFRSVFVYNLKKTCDPSLSIITSPNGLVATVYIWCRKVLLDLLNLLPEHLERFCRVAYPPEDSQPRTILHCTPEDPVIITFKTKAYHEFGLLHEVPASGDCSCGHRSHQERPHSKKKSRVRAQSPSTASTDAPPPSSTMVSTGHPRPAQSIPPQSCPDQHCPSLPNRAQPCDTPSTPLGPYQSYVPPDNSNWRDHA